jgi:serine O-acetyltransferase
MAEPKTLPELVELIVEDWRTHGRDWTLPGFRAVAVARFGQWRMQVEPKAARAPLSVFYRLLFRHVRNVYGIELPFSVKLGRRVKIEHQGGIVVHGDSTIGDDCVLRQGVTLGMRNVAKPFDAPTLGRAVDVGAGAVILGAIHVGDEAKVGANAVLLQDVQAGGVAVGVPARVKAPASSARAAGGGAAATHPTEHDAPPLN